jgi:hypothetical protein
LCICNVVFRGVCEADFDLLVGGIPGLIGTLLDCHDDFIFVIIILADHVSEKGVAAILRVLEGSRDHLQSAIYFEVGDVRLVQLLVT